MVDGVLGALQNRERGKCVNLRDLPYMRIAQLQKGCEELFKLRPNGNIKEEGSENVCISEREDRLAAIDCPENGDISFTTKGAISRPDPAAEENSLPGYACFYVTDERSVLIGLTYNSERNRCEERGNFYRFLGKCRRNG